MKDIDDSKAVLLLEPPAIDARIINQSSFFSVVPDTTDMEAFLGYTNKTTKYIIDKRIRGDIRDMLDRLNICERTMLPGIDGTCLQLNRFYGQNT